VTGMLADLSSWKKVTNMTWGVPPTVGCLPEWRSARLLVPQIGEHVEQVAQSFSEQIDVLAHQIAGVLVPAGEDGLHDGLVLGNFAASWNSGSDSVSMNSRTRPRRGRLTIGGLRMAGL